jgi:hypothetical protein
MLVGVGMEAEVRRHYLFLLLLLVVFLMYGSPYAALLLNRAMGSWSADAVEHDGSVTHMVFDPNLPPAEFVPIYPGASVVGSSRLVSKDAPSGVSFLELAVHGAARDVRDFYLSRLGAEGFAVDDHGTLGLNARAADFLGVAGAVSATRAATDDYIVVQISTEEGLVVRSRLVKLQWRKLSELIRAQPRR